MKRRIMTLIGFSWLLALVAAHSVAAQNGNDWVYAVTKTQESWTIFRIDVAAAQSEVVFSLPTTTTRSVGELLPPEELTLMLDFAKLGSTDSNAIQNLKNAKLTTDIRSVHVSPDSLRIALVTTAKITLRYPRWEDYGITEIVVVDATQRTAFTALTVGLQANPYIRVDAKGRLGPGSVSDIIWAGNSKTFLAAISGTDFSGCLNAELLLFAPETIPQNIGAGVAWAFSQTLDYVGIMFRSPSDCTDELVVSSISPNASPTVQRFVLWDNPVQVYPTLGLHFLDGYWIYGFSDTRREGVGGIAVWDPRTTLKPTVTLPSVGLNALRTTSAMRTAIAQSVDGRLWRFALDGTTPILSLFFNEPVEQWELHDNGKVLLQRPGQTDFTLLDPTGKVERNLEVLAVLRAEHSTLPSLQSGEAKLEYVGWGSGYLRLSPAQ